MPQFTGPTLIPAPLAPQVPIGLFDVALGPMDWPTDVSGGGVIYVPDACEDDAFLIAMDCPAITGAKTFSGVETPVSGAPFAVMTSYTCGSLGFSFDEIEQRVRTRMDLRAQRAVERRVWQGSTGTLGTIPGLFANAPIVGNAACPVEAMEMLEQTLADNGVLDGIIHARPGMAPHLDNNHQIYEVNSRVRRTTLNTKLVFGQGYGGSGPTGQAATADSEWMYASGRVLIWATDTMVSNVGWGLNRTTNQISALGERIFAVAIECGVWAVQVTRNCTSAGSA